MQEKATKHSTQESIAHTQRNYATPFAFFLLMGVIFMMKSPLSLWWAPLVVMAMYGAWGLKTAHNEGLLIEFTDSFYYLGFALTLTALLKTTGVLGGELPGPRMMVQDFGKGLSTTVLGVVGRVYFQLYFQVAQESIEHTTKSIQSLSREYLESLKGANNAVKTNWNNISESVSETALSLKESLSMVDAQIQSIKKQLESQEGAVGNALEKLRLDIDQTNLVKEIDNLTHRIKSLNTSLGNDVATTSGWSSDPNTPTFSVVLAQAAKSLSLINMSSAEANKSIKQLNQNIRDLDKLWREIAEALVRKL